MANKLIIWLQLFAALLLLSDAYLSPRIRETLDNKLKSSVGEFSETYRQRYFRRDLILFTLLVVLWSVFWLWGKAGETIGGWSGSFGLWGVLVIGLWAVVLLFLFSIAMAAFTNHLDKHLNFLVKFPLCFALYKAPKGPIYALGFVLLVFSHIVQLLAEYGKAT